MASGINKPMKVLGKRLGEKPSTGSEDRYVGLVSRNSEGKWNANQGTCRSSGAEFGKK